MFERFTDRARRVVVFAQDEARMLDHNYIGTEHILLGLVHEGDGIAARALESMGISLDGVRQEVEKIIGRGKKQPSGHIPFTPRAKKVMELSLREALQLGDNHIGTEHILLGLVREGDGVAAQVLVRLGADLNRVRQEVIRLTRTEEGRETRVAGPMESGSQGTGSRLVEAVERMALRERPAPGQAWPADVLNSLGKIVDRLDAIERHLGLRSATASEPAAPSGGGEAGGEEAQAHAGAEPEEPSGGDGQAGAGDGQAGAG